MSARQASAAQPASLRRLFTAGPSAVALGVVLLSGALTLTTHSFATLDNLRVIMLGAAVTIVVGLAQLVVLGAAGMNLSVGAVGGIASPSARTAGTSW